MTFDPNDDEIAMDTAPQEPQSSSGLIDTAVGLSTGAAVGTSIGALVGLLVPVVGEVVGPLAGGLVGALVGKFVVPMIEERSRKTPV